LLTSRETGVLAALGVARVGVVRKPRVAILSTGNELVPPGQQARIGEVFDSNATILADAVRELGGEPVSLGIVPDDCSALKEALERALQFDVVLLSGGTSKGEGDLSYRVVGTLGPPGIVAHGVALKPGKPLCLAAVQASRGRQPTPFKVTAPAPQGGVQSSDALHGGFALRRLVFLARVCFCDSAGSPDLWRSDASKQQNL
jgi:molybdenum cofactor synthesis domain-containing protein